jgi:hypothetical protein
VSGTVVIVLVLVLDRLRLQDERTDIQRLEGSRSGACPATLVTYASNRVPPKACEKEAAPANVCSHGSSIGLESRSESRRMEALGATYDEHSQ